MLNKKFFVSLVLLVSISVSAFASFGFDVGLNYSSTQINDDGTEGESEYPFSFVALPSFSSGNFMMELNVPLYFKLDTSFVTFDYSNFELPVSQNDLYLDAMNYLSFGLNYINYIQFGNFNSDFAFRIGKITNSSIGDGALLSHYKDVNVGKFETRPGAQVKLDGNMISFPLGIEFITTDMFNPDLLGGRVNIKPLFFLSNGFLNKFELGYTVTYNTQYGDSSDNWYNLAYDAQLPIFKTTDNSLIAYYDLISEMKEDTSTDPATDYRQLSQRFGLYGWYLTSFNFDAHIKTIIDNNALDSDFATLNSDLISKTILPQLKPDFIINANTGYYSNNGLSEFVLASELEFNDVKLDAYNINFSAKSQKALGPISDIAIFAQKDFYKDSSDTFTEDFIEGFTSVKNLTVELSANVIFYQINEITVNLSLEGDADGNLVPKYSLGYKFSLF